MPLTLTYGEILSIAGSSALWYGLRWVFPLGGPFYLSNALWDWPYVLNLDWMAWATSLGVGFAGLTIFKTGILESLLGITLGLGINYLVGVMSVEAATRPVVVPQAK